jgi:hypothetical protein
MDAERDQVASDAHWFYRSGKSQSGPVSLDSLEELLRNGSITEETLVWNGKSAEGKWIQLKTVEEFLSREGVLLTPAPPASFGEILKNIGRFLLLCFLVVVILNRIDSPILNSIAIFLVIGVAYFLFWGAIGSILIRIVKDIIHNK